MKRKRISHVGARNRKPVEGKKIEPTIVEPTIDEPIKRTYKKRAQKKEDDNIYQEKVLGEYQINNRNEKIYDNY